MSAVANGTRPIQPIQLKPVAGEIRPRANGNQGEAENDADDTVRDSEFADTGRLHNLRFEAGDPARPSAPRR
jgi:hypothetical protein